VHKDNKKLLPRRHLAQSERQESSAWICQAVPLIKNSAESIAGEWEIIARPADFLQVMVLRCGDRRPCRVTVDDDTTRPVFRVLVAGAEGAHCRPVPRLMMGERSLYISLGQLAEAA
jgi:hypothetical protein